MVHYFRTTPDGRIAFGWGGGRVVPGARLNGRAELDRAVVAEVERQLVRFFPALAGRRIEHALGRPDRRLADPSAGARQPRRRPRPLRVRLHRQRRRALVDGRAGARGHGARAGDQATVLPIVGAPAVRVPPEPLRYAAGRSCARRRCGASASRRRAGDGGLLARAISGLPDRIGIHVGR